MQADFTYRHLFFFFFKTCLCCVSLNPFAPLATVHFWNVTVSCQNLAQEWIFFILLLPLLCFSHNTQLLRIGPLWPIDALISMPRQHVILLSILFYFTDHLRLFFPFMYETNTLILDLYEQPSLSGHINDSQHKWYLCVMSTEVQFVYVDWHVNGIFWWFDPE